MLVILGLLTGGILAGRSLIRASELRSVTSEADKHKTSIMSFRGKYLGLPGDLTNATAFWGKDATLCNSHTGTAATPGTCNGNGSGVISDLGVGVESYRAWQHLSFAGIIEGNYAGTITNSITTSVLGIDIPASKLANAGWTFVDFSQLASVNDELGYTDLPNTRLNMLFIGGVRPLSANRWANLTVLRPEEAWNIDTKIDDGMPGKGKIRGGRHTTCTTGSTSDSEYQLQLNDTRCFLGFQFL